MARREEEFKGLRQERERLKAQRKLQRKAERDMARRREYIRRCTKLVRALWMLAGWHQCARVA